MEKFVEKDQLFTIRSGSAGVKSDSGRYGVMLGDAVNIVINALDLSFENF